MIIFLLRTNSSADALELLQSCTKPLISVKGYTAVECKIIYIVPVSPIYAKTSLFSWKPLLYLYRNFSRSLYGYHSENCGKAIATLLDCGNSSDSAIELPKSCTCNSTADIMKDVVMILLMHWSSCSLAALSQSIHVCWWNVRSLQNKIILSLSSWWESAY